MFDRFKSLPAAFFERASREPDKILYSQFVREDSHVLTHSLIKRSNEDVVRRVCALACFLKKAGLSEGDAVGIISATRPEWLEADMAIMAAGGVVVSLYPSLVEAEIAYILFDSATRFLFVENIEQLKKIDAVLSRSFQMPATDDRPSSEERVKLVKIISFEGIGEHDNAVTLGQILENSAQQGTDFNHDWYRHSDKDSLASIVYTSGTTGPQKGVMQIHGNHLSNIRQAQEGGLYQTNSIIFMLLPLAHSFSRLMGYIGFIAGTELQFPSISDAVSSRANQRRTLLDLSQCNCTVIPLVPRILEKMKEGIELQASRDSFKGFLIRSALKAAQSDRQGISNLLQSIVFIFTEPLRKQIRKKLFGESFEYVISGGAKLAPDVNRFFSEIGIEVLEGYGLTETCVATNCNRPGKNRIGTVGPLLASDIEMRISADGEILFRGPNISKGYLNQPLATQKAWDSEGWFHTGDIGSVDEEGCLTITGRKKEIIVTAGGKKISPERIEALLKAHELVSQAMLVGEGRPYCVAIITLDREKLQSLRLKYQLTDIDKVFGHSDLTAQIVAHLDFCNSQLASFESVKKILIIRDELSVENGFLTPTLKMRRGPIVEHCRKDIERLYASSDKVMLER